MVFQKRFWLSIVIIIASIPSVALAFNQTTEPTGLLNQLFQGVYQILSAILGFSIAGMPLIVLWLIAGSFFFTIRMKFINFRALKHAIDITRGKYDDLDEPGEVTHFQALATALSGTVGLGNIAGVALAISVGGPGAAFWMTVAGFLAMTMKFVECTLGQKYRILRPDGTIAGGPMHYLEQGLAEKGYPKLGKLLAILFCIFAMIGGGCGSTMFQTNQSYLAVAQVFPWFVTHAWVYGLIMVLLVGLVILGGIQSIGAVAGTIVPLMCGIYVLAALWVISANISMLPTAISQIITEAFHPQAVAGGMMGTLVQGFRRAAYSNTAGQGVAAIAHAAAQTNEPVREGIVSLLEPLIDTIIVCNLTALVMVITGAYNNPQFSGLNGTQLTQVAFGSVISWFPYILAVCIFLFAYSTVMSWGYYSELCWEYLFGKKGNLLLKSGFLMIVFLGAVINPKIFINLSDLMLISVAFPNLLGCYFLGNDVALDLKSYMTRLQRGEFQLELISR
ncbi:sodium:alanine symporter family protein [Chroococcus sp. FPU101]|uniref:alanine/glycine:cation symporter family protein n=1 Tax=Chroococcus sp. FPU101 TaxID=1974212 RepID=UPI001A8E34A1|nr:alanine/glycine:cation symporter family protein [Chroococcus sp. FPU101]GFE68493.1 amino acid carrier protein [Chroococcus sp. FPU101]